MQDSLVKEPRLQSKEKFLPEKERKREGEKGRKRERGGGEGEGGEGGVN